MPVELSDRSTTMRPSPFAPRRKSTSRSACCASPGRGFGEALTPCRLGVERSLWSNSVTSTVLPSTCVSNGLRLVEVEHDAGAVAGLDDVEAAQRRRRRRPAACAPRPLPVSRKSSAMRGGLVDREAGRRIGRRRLQRELDDRCGPSCPCETVSASMLLAPCANAAPAAPTQHERRASASARRLVRPCAARRCSIASRTRSSSSLLCLGIGLAAAAACWIAPSSRRRRPAPAPSAESRHR